MLNDKPTAQTQENNLHRQRLTAALDHQISDRIPLTLGSPSCSIHQQAHSRLLDYLGYRSKNRAVITDNILQIVETDAHILEYFDIDMLWLLPKAVPVKLDQENIGFTDPFGRKFIAGGGFFNQVEFPLYDCKQEDLRKYQFPVFSPERFEHLGDRAQEIYDRGFGIGIDGPWGIYEISSSLVGTSEYLMNLILDPNLAREVAERVLENYIIPFYDLLLDETSSKVQVVGISDDLGAQSGLLFSPNLYRQIFKPLHKRLIDHIHSKTDAKVYMHSDGSIFPIIPDLIEIGVEGLNPVQYTAKDMGLENLINNFGKDLGFFGGVVENEVLSFRSPQQIRELAKKNVKILMKNKAFIFAPIHNISQEVSPENIIALYKAGAEFGRY